VSLRIGIIITLDKPYRDDMQELMIPPRKKLPAVTNVLIESWNLVKGFKRPIFLLIMANVLLIIGYIKLSAHVPFVFMIFVKLAFICFMGFITAMGIILGVRRSAGLPIKLRFVLKECVRASPPLFKIIIILYMVRLVLVDGLILIAYLHLDFAAGFLLDFLVYATMVFLCVLTMAFVFPLTVIKRYSVAEAFKVGFKLMRQYWPKLMSAYLAMGTLVFLGTFPAFIWLLFASMLSRGSHLETYGIILALGSLWTIPMFCVMNGIWFREIFGLKSKKI
jgi:hypothetical protein